MCPQLTSDLSSANPDGSPQISGQNLWLCLFSCLPSALVLIKNIANIDTVNVLGCLAVLRSKLARWRQVVPSEGSESLYLTVGLFQPGTGREARTHMAARTSGRTSVKGLLSVILSHVCRSFKIPFFFSLFFFFSQFLSVDFIYGKGSEIQTSALPSTHFVEI